MKKKLNNHKEQTFNYGLIAQASALALAALAAQSAYATSPSCSISASTSPASTAAPCVIYDATPNANVTIGGAVVLSGGLTTGDNTSLGEGPRGIMTASGGSIIVQSGGIITNSTGPGINLGRSAGYGSGASISPTTTTALTGSISNAGTISGSNYGIASTISGTGVVGGIVNASTGVISSSTTASGAGIWVASGSSITGGITNSGTISAPTSGTASGSGILVNGFLGGGLTNSATGTIVGFTGLSISGGTISGGISNNGGTISGAANAIVLSGGLVGDLNNSGRIQSTSSSHAVVLNTGSTITGNIVNSGQISLTAGSESGYGLNLQGRVTGSISNSGTITGLAVGSAGSVSGAILNTGSITSNGLYSVLLTNTSSNAVTINNNGGSILGGTANLGDRNTLNLNAGYISSTVTASGTTVLNIAGTVSSVTGSAVGATSRITGPIFMSAGSATINVNGGFVAENTMSANTLNVNSGGTLYTGFNPANTHSMGSGGLNILSGGTLSAIGNTTVTGSLVNAGAVAIASGKGIQIYGGSYTQNSTGVLQIGVASNTAYGSLYVGGGTIGMGTAPKVDVVVSSGASLTVGSYLKNVIYGGSITGGAASSYVVTDNSDAYDFTAETCSFSLSESTTCSPNGIGLRIAAATPTALGKTPATRPLVTTGVSGTIFQMLRMGNNVVQAVSSSNSSGGGINTGDVLRDRHGWIKPLVMRSKQNDEGTVSGYKADSYGIIGGMDGNYNDKTRLGVAVSYMTSKVESNRSLATHDADISSWRVIGYGSYALSANTEATFQGDYSTGTIKGRRQIAVGDVASSNYKNSTLHFSGALSRVIEMTPGKTTFTPTLRVDYTYSRDGGYTETGGSTNLVVQSNISKEMIVAAQGKINHAMSSNTTLSVNASIGYDVIGQQSSLTAAALGGGASFVATGLAPQREVYQLGVGSLTKLAAGGEVNLRYDLETRRGFTGQSVSVKYRMPF